MVFTRFEVISIRLNNLKKTALWFRSQLCRLQLSENWVVRVASRSQRTKSISKCRNVHCDWFIQGLQILLMSGVSVTSASQILESFWNIWSQSSITTKKAIFRLSSTWSWHVYTIVRDTRSSCGGPLTWKAQIHDGGHRVNFDRNLPSSCFVVQYNSLISMI